MPRSGAFWHITYDRGKILLSDSLNIRYQGFQASAISSRHCCRQQLMMASCLRTPPRRLFSVFGLLGVLLSDMFAWLSDMFDTDFWSMHVYWIRILIYEL